MVVGVVWMFVEWVENDLVVEVWFLFSLTFLETLIGDTGEVWVGLLLVVEFVEFDVILETEVAVISEDVNESKGLTVVLCHHLNLMCWNT